MEENAKITFTEYLFNVVKSEGIRKQVPIKSLWNFKYEIYGKEIITKQQNINIPLPDDWSYYKYQWIFLN